MRKLAHRLIDAFEAEGEGDLVRLFTYPLPVIVICEMLGIPESDHHRFLESSGVAGRVIDPTPMTEMELADANASALESHAYFSGLLDARRAAPEDDLLTALVQAETTTASSTTTNSLPTSRCFSAPGTKRPSISWAMACLHSGAIATSSMRCARTFSLMPSAVEEMLRFDSSVQLTGRKALEDVEFNGHLIRKGEQLLALIGAANHDPAAFDEPERFDVRRDGRKPLSFGGGIHLCLGAQRPGRSNGRPFRCCSSDCRTSNSPTSTRRTGSRQSRFEAKPQRNAARELVTRGVNLNSGRTSARVARWRPSGGSMRTGERTTRRSRRSTLLPRHASPDDPEA